MKYKLILAIILCQFSSLAQIKQVGNADVTEYPDVKININLHSIEEKDSGDFTITENEEEIQDFEIKKSDSMELADNKCVVFLWESLNGKNYRKEHKKEFYFFRELLKSTINNVIEDGDEIAIATFGCIKAGGDALNYIYDFGSNTSSMHNAVQEYESPNNIYHNKDYSDLHYAIDEAIKDLSNHKTELPKAIYVFSAEYNNKQNSSSNAQDNIASANKYNIQIHTIKYDITGYGKHHINHIAQRTNGSDHKTDRKKENGENEFEQGKRNLNDAGIFVKKSYNEIPLRSYGIDYTISFKSSHDKDGKVHALEIKSMDGEKATIGYQSPKANWFLENLLWVCIGGVLILTLIIFLLIYNKKEKEKRAMKQAQELNHLKEEQSRKDNESKEKFQQQEMQMKLIKDKEQAEQNKQLTIQRKKEKEAHLQNMKEEMNRSGNLPVLHFSIGDQHGSITIEEPVFKIGRDKNNDLHINHQTVSRNHLDITFDGKGFNVIDNGSANGTLLNGNKVKQSDLRDGDILQVGEVKIVYSK